MSNTKQIIWFSGLSGAGKSTVAAALADELRRCGRSVMIIDGDVLRRGLCEDLGYSMEDRCENVRRAAHMAHVIGETVDVVLIALITPLESMRQMASTIIPGLRQVFVDAPLDLCEARDPRGLYRRVRDGSLANFTGIDSPFERPLAPDLICPTAHLDLEQCTRLLLQTFFGESAIAAEATARRSTLAVDFDGVIADYDGWIDTLTFGAPREDVAAALRLLHGEGWKIVVHTTRSADAIREYLDTARIPYDEINRNSDYSNHGQKPVATVYWDDRGLRYSGDAAHDISSDPRL